MSDVIVTVSTLAVAAGFAYLYYRDINQQISSSGQKPIGTITYERNVAQRKFGDRVVWQQVSDNSSLFNQDSIRTAANSEAIIRLADGTKIALAANTLITLDWGAKTKAVDFLAGSITAIRTGGAVGAGAAGAGRAGSGGAGGRTASGRRAQATGAAGPSGAAAGGLVIRSGRSEVVLDKATVNLARGKGDRLAVDVAAGEARLAAGDSERTVGAAQAATVNTATGAATVTNLPIAPVEPAANAVFVTRTDAAPVAFSWRAGSPVKSYTLELASTPDFASGASTFPASAESARERVAPGVYYWRVSAPEGTASPAEQLTVLRDVPIVPESPANGATIGYGSAFPLVAFSWSPSEVAGSYELEVASDAQFSKVVARVSSATNSISVSSLGAGSYYWRVLPVYGFSAPSVSDASAPASFRIVRDASLKAPVLVAPAEGADLNTFSINSAGLLFNWRPDNAIASWTLVVARDRGLKDFVLQEATANNFFLMSRPLDPGRYYWQVRGVDGYGVESPPSATRAFKVHRRTATINLKSPEANWAYDGSTFANVPVVWQSDLLGHYEVQLSTRADFSALYSQIKTTFNNASFGSLPPGTYFWHVVLLSSDGSTLLSSGDRSFTVLPPLVAPIAVAPAPGKSFSLINAARLAFRWDGDPRSQFYDFTLYGPGPGAGGGERIIAAAKNLTGNEFVLKDLGGIVPGDYTWEVTAHNPGGPRLSAQASLPTLANFTIRHVRIIPAPKLLSPTPHMTIDGPSALDQGVVFSWVSPDPQGSAVVQVASDSNFSKGLRQLPAGPGQSSVTISELLPGTYYWQVKAMTRDGIEAPASAINEFTVATLPSLEQPAAVTPTEGSTVNMQNKSSLDFSWSPVPDATSYSIWLTNVQTGERVFKIDNVKGTTFAFNDLTKLNIGAFVWAVEATQTDRTGQAVRSSAPLETRFGITLGKIGPAEINSPGRFFVH